MQLLEREERGSIEVLYRRGKEEIDVNIREKRERKRKRDL